MTDFILKACCVLIPKLIPSMKHLETSPNTRRIIWGCLLVALWYGAPSLIAAIRWW